MEKQEHLIVIVPKEEIFLIGKSMAVLFLLNFCFYRQLPTLIFLLPLICGFYRLEKKELLRKKKEEVRQQFKELLLLAVTGLRAGNSVENAFLNSCPEMEMLYGKESCICRMLLIFRGGLENHVSPEVLFREMGEDCEIEEIRDFSRVFSIAKETGGNMTVIMERTAKIIESRTETKKEIETLLSGRKLEQKIMNTMPFLLMMYMSLTSPGYFRGLYGTPEGVAVMTFCLGIYLCAYLMSLKIMEMDQEETMRKRVYEKSVKGSRRNFV